MEKTFESYLETQTPSAQDKLVQLFTWIDEHYPKLEKVIKWNQPMYVDHGTFIIGFSTSKNHIAVSPEPYVIEFFKKEIEAANYNPSSNLFRITWNQEFDLDLFKKLIDFQIDDKKDFTGFWRT